MTYPYVGKLRANEHLFILEDAKHGDGRDFALWFARQLIHSHQQGFSIDTNSLPKILKSGHNISLFTYEYPLVMKKAWLDRTAIHKDIISYHCGSVHHQFINGFYGGVFCGVFNQLFTSWPVTNLIFPKAIPPGKVPEDYPMKLLSQWTLNGIVRTFRVVTFSLAVAFVYDFSEQVFKQARNKDDFLNPVFAGALTGSIIGLKRNVAKCKSTAVLFAFLVSCYDQIDRQNYKLNESSFPSRNSAFFY